MVLVSATDILADTEVVPAMLVVISDASDDFKPDVLGVREPKSVFNNDVLIEDVPRTGVADCVISPSDSTAVLAIAGTGLVVETGADAADEGAIVTEATTTELVGAGAEMEVASGEEAVLDILDAAEVTV